MKAAFCYGMVAAVVVGLAHAGLAKEIKISPTILDGKWVGDGFTLIVDAARMQANVDSEKPFQWDAFNILDVSGQMIVFEVGKRRYIGLVKKDRSLKVTGGSLVGEQTLFRPGARPRDPRFLGHE